MPTWLNQLDISLTPHKGRCCVSESGHGWTAFSDVHCKAFQVQPFKQCRFRHSNVLWSFWRSKVFRLNIYKKRSFSSMNRVCTKLRQRMTPDHLSQLLLISIEGPEILSRRDIVNIVYIWYKKGNRRIQLPDRLQWLYFTWLFWATTSLWLGSEVVKLWSVQLFYVGPMEMDRLHVIVYWSLALLLTNCLVCSRLLTYKNAVF